MHTGTGAQQAVAEAGQVFFNSAYISARTAEYEALVKSLGPRAEEDPDCLRMRGELEFLMAEQRKGDRQANKDSRKFK